MAKVKFYAVAVGRKPGVYNTWGECQEQVSFSCQVFLLHTIMHSNCKLQHHITLQTSKYSGAIFKSFKTPHEAQAFINAHSQGGTSATDRKRPPDNDKMVTAVASSTTRTSALSSTISKQITTTNNAQLQITIHFDGGSRGNPGLAGSGAEVKVQNCSTSKTTTYLIREYVGASETNNYAEYKGLIAGLHKAKTCIEQYKNMKQTHTTTSTTNRPLFHVQFYGDSKLVIEQLKGNWRCKHPNLQTLYQLCQKLIHEIKQIDTNSTVTCDHVYREQNKIADGLANEAMDKKRSWTTTTESTVDHKSDTNEDERKLSAVPVSKKRKSGSVWESEKGRDVIDVDDSDSDESYNC